MPPYFKHFISIFAISLSFLAVSSAQTASIDSLISKSKQQEFLGNVDSSLLILQSVYPLLNEKEHSIKLIEADHSIGSLYYLLGNFKESKFYFFHANELLESKLSTNTSDSLHTLYAFNLDRIGLYYAQTNEQDKALEYRLKATEYADKYVTHKITHSICFNGLGNAYINNNQPQLALEAYTKAVDIMQLQKKRLLKSEHKVSTDEVNKFIAVSYNNIGVSYELLEQFDKSLEFYEKSYKIRKKILAEDHPSIAESLYNLSFIYEHRGYFEEALQFNKKSLEIINKKYGEEHPEMIDILNVMGKIKFSQGDIGQGEAYLDQAIHIHKRKLGDTFTNDIAEVYKSKAYAKLLNKSPDEAIKYLVFCQKHWQKFPLKKANTLCLLARAKAQKGLFEEAYTAVDDALLSLKNKADIQSSTAVALILKAELLIEQERFIKARPLLQQSLNILQGQKDTQRQLLAETYLLLAQSHLEDETTFQQYLAKAYRVCSSQEEGEELSQLLFQEEYIKAQELEGDFLRNTKKNPSAALDKYEQALKQSFDQRIEYHSDNAHQLQTEEARLIVGKMLSILSEELKEKPTLLDDIHALIEKAKAQSLKENLRGLRTDRFKGIPSSYTKKEASLKTDLNYLKKELHYLSVIPSKAAQASTLKSKIFKTNQSLESLQKSLQLSYPDYYRLKYVASPLPLSKIQSSLLEDETLINYLMDESHLYLIKIEKDRSRFYKIGIDSSFRKNIHAFKKAIIQKDKALLANLGYQIHNTLFKQVNVKQKLIIIPDGDLNILPFELLTSTKASAESSFLKWDFLLQKHAISYHYSADLFYEERQKNNTASKSLISIAPDYSGSIYQNLPYAKAEAEAVAEIMDGETITGKSASTKSFWSKTRDHNIVHLATHALLDDYNPLYSKLIFAPQEGKDNFVHTADLYRINLNAQLVTISACNSGNGKIQKGEGIISLARGFSYAGCPSILTSSWKVSDASSKIIMESFYRYLKIGETKAEALRLAKIDFLQNSNKINSDPFYWAGFQLIGDSRMLTKAQAFYLQPSLILAFLLVCLPILYFLFLKFKD